jgi:hypothetical protein
MTVPWDFGSTTMLVVLGDATHVCAGPQSCEGGQPPQVPWHPSSPQVFPVQFGVQAPPEDEVVVAPLLVEGPVLDVVPPPDAVAMPDELEPWAAVPLPPDPVLAPLPVVLLPFEEHAATSAASARVPTMSGFCIDMASVVDGPCM